MLVTSLALAAFGTVSLHSLGITGSVDAGLSLTGGPFLEWALRNVAELDRGAGGGA